MNTVINGFKGGVVNGSNISIARLVNIMADLGSNAGFEMQVYFPLQVGCIKVGNHSWVGANGVYYA